MPKTVEGMAKMSSNTQSKILLVVVVLLPGGCQAAATPVNTISNAPAKASIRESEKVLRNREKARTILSVPP